MKHSCICKHITKSSNALPSCWLQPPPSWGDYGNTIDFFTEQTFLDLLIWSSPCKSSSLWFLSSPCFFTFIIMQIISKFCLDHFLFIFILQIHELLWQYNKFFVTHSIPWLICFLLVLTSHQLVKLWSLPPTLSLPLIWTRHLTDN